MLDNWLRRQFRHGAYACLRPRRRRCARGRRRHSRARRELGLQNERPPPARRLSRRVPAPARRDAGAADDGVALADAVVHVAAPTASPVSDFCAEATRLLGPLARLRVIGGVVRPRTYTGAAMNNFAYAHQVVQQPGRVMPNAFLVPMNKTAAWWAKDWMERHTYFLPRYDDEGRMKSEGHALASAAGIPCLLRRTYKSTSEPAPEGAYDFVTYFECADADVPTFHQVCASLRDVARNPEWKFVREGPTWHGRRVATWPDLFSSVR
jgi:hypothetical protein